MATKTPIVAIVGRTNVGKSTLFNSFVGKRMAVVEDSPGVTRDRNYALITRFDIPFTLIDTGGLVEEHATPLEDAIVEQSEVAIAEADAIIAVFDGQAGVHPHDRDVAERLRRVSKPVFWVVNKCEKESTKLASLEFHALGIEPIFQVSAKTRAGTLELIEAVTEQLRELFPEPAPGEPEDDSIRVAVVGKPNVGKSTLLNRLLGEERFVASDLPGTTRDSVDAHYVRDGRRFTLVDTAGLRRKARVDDETAERFSNIRALSALSDCDVAVLVIDASQGEIADQDQKIAELIHERGRGLVIALNKWDIVEKDHRTAKAFSDHMRAALPFARYAPILFVSALTGKRCPNLFDEVLKVYESSNAALPKEELDEALKAAFARRPPPVYHGEPIRFMGAEQIGNSPPALALTVNHPRGIRPSYERYLKNTLREKFPLEGVDIRMVFRKPVRRGKSREAREQAMLGNAD